MKILNNIRKFINRILFGFKFIYNNLLLIVRSRVEVLEFKNNKDKGEIDVIYKTLDSMDNISRLEVRKFFSYYKNDISVNDLIKIVKVIILYEERINKYELKSLDETHKKLVLKKISGQDEVILDFQDILSSRDFYNMYNFSKIEELILFCLPYIKDKQELDIKNYDNINIFHSHLKLIKNAKNIGE